MKCRRNAYYLKGYAMAYGRATIIAEKTQREISTRHFHTLGFGILSYSVLL